MKDETVGAPTPAVFSPDNEPYLGRQALLVFDKEIPFSLWVSSHIAAYTRSNRERLTDLQRAACQIVPQGINLALSLRELIRQGYLFAALVLVRPLIERAAIISYICDHPEAIEQWKDGWRFRQRPSLNTMLRCMAPSGVDADAAKDICEHYGPHRARGSRVRGVEPHSAGRRFTWLCRGQGPRSRSTLR
jgi:hypothetical protein